jgi:hypothetical protein
MVVRYPSHRRFLAMTLNPYYLAINRFRERGVASFEASFTYPHDEPGALRAQRWLLVAHYDEPTTLAALREVVEPQAGPLVYAARQVATVGFLRGRRPTDPNPLTYPRLACFAAQEDTIVNAPALAHATLQLYRSTPPRALLAKAR